MMLFGLLVPAITETVGYDDSVPFFVIAVLGFIPFIIGKYNPNINNNVEPDIPGKIIADIAIIPTINIQIQDEILKLVKDILATCVEL